MIKILITRKILITPFLILLGCLSLKAQCTGYGTSLTGTAAQVSANQTNFPVVIKQSNATLKTVANGGSVTSASGFDICFSNFTNTVAYNYWLVGYTGSSGYINFIVNFPTLSSTATTSFKIWAGKGSITTDQSSTLTFDSNFAQWYLLNEASSPYIDITANTNDSTGGTYPVQITSGCALGASDVCSKFATASSQYIQVPNAITSGDSTMSVWFQMGTLTGNPQQLIDTRVNGSSMGCTLGLDATGHIFAACGVNGPITAAGASNDGQWHHGALTIQGNTLRLYLDGVQQATSGSGWAGFTTGNSYFGRSYTNIHYFNGNLEQARISSTARSASWVATEAANMQNPTTFVSLSGGSGNFTISPIAAPSNNAAPMVLTLTGIGTNWVAQTFTITGCGTKSSQIIDSTTSVRLLITTSATVCIATVSDGTLSAQIPIGSFGGGSNGAIFIFGY